MDREHAEGADALSAALARRGWNAVLYGGDEPSAVPARKALAMTRLADPHLPFVAVSPNVRRGDLSSIIRGLDDAAMVISDPRELAPRLTKRARRRAPAPPRRQRAPPAARPAGDRRPPRRRARLPRRCASACSRRSARRSAGASARSGGPTDEDSILAPTAVWHAAGASAEVADFAEQTREERFAPGQGVPGRVWAFRRPSWISDLSRDTRTTRSTGAMRAGLMTAVAFPLAAGDELRRRDRVPHGRGQRAQRRDLRDVRHGRRASSPSTCTGAGWSRPRAAACTPSSTARAGSWTPPAP